MFFVVHFSATFRCILGVQENRGGLIWLVWSVNIDISFRLDIDQVIYLCWYVNADINCFFFGGPDEMVEQCFPCQFHVEKFIEQWKIKMAGYTLTLLFSC